MITPKPAPSIWPQGRTVQVIESKWWLRLIGDTRYLPVSFDSEFNFLIGVFDLNGLQWSGRTVQIGNRNDRYGWKKVVGLPVGLDLGYINLNLFSSYCGEAFYHL